MKELFDPRCDKFPYTEYTDQHYLKIKTNNGLVFDENYPYIDTSKKFKRKYKFTRFLLHLFVFLVASIRLNLHIKGKKNLKKFKEVLDNGAITVCNHVHMWDTLALLKAFKHYHPMFLAWDKNVTGENSNLVRSVGGIPIPVDNFGGTKAYLKTVTDFLNNKGILHVNSEGSMWEFYQPIRPFKQGAAYFAYRTNKPILPLAFKYRKNGIIRKLFHSPASFTLTIGEPIYPNYDLERREAIDDLTIRSHDAVCMLAGIDPKENIYPPLFDNNKRIDYYTTEYGKGYKTSR